MYIYIYIHYYLFIYYIDIQYVQNPQSCSRYITGGSNPPENPWWTVGLKPFVAEKP